MALLPHSWVHYYTVGKTFQVGEEIIHKQDTFSCTQQHVASADKEPGVGAAWASYWTKTSDARETPAVPRLADMDDVDVTGISDGDTLIYNSSTGLYEPGAPGATLGPVARVSRNADQSIVSGTPTAVSWDTSTFETDSTMWNIATPTRIYARGAGKYGFKMAGRWAANGTGYRYVYVYKNGVAHRPFAEFPPAPNAGRASYFGISDTLDLADGDYIEVFVFHNSSTTPLALQGGFDTTYCCLERLA